MSSLGIYESDSIANYIVDMWRQLSDERDVHLNRLTDLRSYLMSPDTSYTEVNKNGWKNRTVTPKLTQIYDNLQAQYLAALHPNDSWVSFEGRTLSDREKEDLVERYIRHKLNESKFTTVERELLADWIWAGYACAGVEHVDIKTKSLTSSEDITKYYGPKAFRLSPYDFVLEPRAASFEDSLFIRRRLIPRTDLLKHNNENSLLQYDEKVVQWAFEITGYVREEEDNYKESDLRVDGYNSLQEYFDSGYVEVLEVWGDVYNHMTGELMQNVTVGIIDRMYTLWNQPNPMWNGKRPYAFTSWRNRPDNLYGQGPLEQLVGMQYRIDHLENTKADILDMTLHPVVVISGDETEDFKWGPEEVYYMGAESRVDVLRPDASALQINTEIFNLMNLMEEMAGSPKQTAGFRTPGEKTAFEVAQLNEGAMKMFLEKTRHWENTLLSDLLNNFYTLMAMNFNAEDVLRVIDDFTQVEELITVTKEDVIRDGNFKLKGSENYAARNKILLDLRDGLSILASNEMTAMHIDGLAIDKMVEQQLDWEGYGIIKEFAAITSQIDAAMVQQSYTQKAQEMTGGPTGVNEGGT